MLLYEIHNSGKFEVIKSGSVQINGKTFTQHPVDRRSGYKLVLLDAKLLEKLWERGGEDFIVGKGPEYNNQISNRIDKFKTFYKENDEIRVGDLHVRENGIADFGDGRHRTRVLIELGLKQIPISMDEQSIQNLMVSEAKGGSTYAKLIRAAKKNKAKRMNPKDQKTTNLPSSGSRPNDHEAAMGSTSHGSRYQASLSTVND